MLPQVINNFLFEKSFIYDLVTLVYPNRKITNIIPYSFTRQFTKAGSQSLEERRWYLYYGYFLVSKGGDSPQTVTFSSDTMEVVKWENFSYQVDQFLILANSIALLNATPSVCVHFIGYRIQMEDTGKLPDFYVPPVDPPDPPETVEMWLHNRLGFWLDVYINNNLVGRLDANTGDILVRILRGPTNVKFSNSLGAAVQNAFLESKEAAHTTGVSIPYTGFEQVFPFDSTPDVERHITVYTKVEEPPREVVVKAYLTDQADIYNKTVIEFTLPRLDFDLTFKIARCVVNTSSGLNYCYGVNAGTGAGDPEAITEVVIIKGSDFHRIFLEPSPGKSYGYVDRIQISNVSDAHTVFTKFPDSSWTLIVT